MKFVFPFSLNLYYIVTINFPPWTTEWPVPKTVPDTPLLPEAFGRLLSAQKCDRRNRNVQEHQAMAVTVADTPRPVGACVVRLLPAGRAHRRRRERAVSRSAAFTGSCLAVRLTSTSLLFVY